MVNVRLSEGMLVTVKDPCTSNQSGGTEQIIGIVKARIVKTWYDYEIGTRCIGELFREEDIALSMEVGKIEGFNLAEFEEKFKNCPETLKYAQNYDPKRVYFGKEDIEELK